MTFILILFCYIMFLIIHSLVNVLKDNKGAEGPIDMQSEFLERIQGGFLYYIIRGPLQVIDYIDHLKFLKYKDLYVSRSAISKGRALKKLYYDIKDEDGCFKSHKMLIKCIGLYKRLDHIRVLEEHEYVKCVKLDDTATSLKSMKKFNI